MFPRILQRRQPRLSQPILPQDLQLQAPPLVRRTPRVTPAASTTTGT
jgi:hypothetical protein